MWSSITVKKSYVKFHHRKKSYVKFLVDSYFMSRYGFQSILETLEFRTVKRKLEIFCLQIAPTPFLDCYLLL